MLFLTRKLGEEIVINHDIQIYVAEIHGKSVKLGFTFPEDVSVLRKELYERIKEEEEKKANPRLFINI